jgi:hypothetical protein
MANELRPLQCKISTGTTDNDTMATKGYVDDQIGGGSATHENLTISTPGQTAFTLASTPIDPAKSQLYLNGQLRKYGGGEDYTISGTSLTWNDPGGVTLLTTDDFQIWYNISIGGGILDQSQIFYVAKAGDDGNNGKSVERPFLTIGAAVTAINLLTPGTGNRFEIQVIGSDTYSESFTVPTYTTVNAPSIRISGTVTLVDRSAIICDQITAPGSGNGIVMTTAVEAFAKANLLDGGTNSVGIDLISGQLRADIKHINMIGSSSKTWNLNTGAALFISNITLRENVASTKTGGAVTFIDSLDYGSNADTFIYNETGDTIIDVDGNNFILKDTAVGEIFTNTGVYPKWTNTPNFEADSNTSQTNVTGDGTNYTVIFDQEFVDVGNNYNNATGVFTAPVTGNYMFFAAVECLGLTSSHVQCQLEFNAAGTKRIIRCNPWNVRDTVTNSVGFNGSVKVRLTGSQTCTVVLTISGGTKVVSIPTNAQFAGYLLTL